MNDPLDRLIQWLEAQELESRQQAANYHGKAEAFREAALKARFASQSTDYQAWARQTDHVSPTQ